MSARWIVTDAVLSSEARRFGWGRAWYSLHVRGLHADNGESFAWCIDPSTNPELYDYRFAAMDAETLAVVGKAQGNEVKP